jgi:hypothetical protein
LLIAAGSFTRSWIGGPEGGGECLPATAPGAPGNTCAGVAVTMPMLADRPMMSSPAKIKPEILRLHVAFEIRTSESSSR